MKLKLMRWVLHLWRSRSLMHAAWKTWPQLREMQGWEPSSSLQTTQLSCLFASFGEQHSGSRQCKCSASSLQPWQECPQSSSSLHGLISAIGWSSGTRPLPFNTRLTIRYSSSRSPMLWIGFLSLWYDCVADTIFALFGVIVFCNWLLIRNFLAF